MAPVQNTLRAFSPARKTPRVRKRVELIDQSPNEKTWALFGNQGCSWPVASGVRRKVSDHSGRQRGMPCSPGTIHRSVPSTIGPDYTFADIEMGATEASGCAGFSDAFITNLSTRAEGRRRRSAKARNRGRWGAEGAAGAMAIEARAT